MSQRYHDVQRRICERYAAPWLEAPSGLKVGVARNVKSFVQPVNGLRIRPDEDTTGWFIWAGGEMSSASDFFVPLHVERLEDWRTGLTRYLGLGPGWRFLVDLETGYEDVWEDPELLKGS